MKLQLQLVFNEADEKRNNLAILKRGIKDQLESLTNFSEITDQLQKWQQKKKELIESVMNDNKADIEKIESLELELKSQKQMISDIALRDYLNGDKIEIVKPDGAIMEPVFTVKFRKTGEYKKDEKKKKVRIPDRLDLE